MRRSVLGGMIMAAVLACVPMVSRALTIQEGVTVGKKTCDVVTWTDSHGQQRSVALVRSNGDGKFSGGYIEQYTYLAGDKKVTCKSDETMSEVSGLGCAVDHHSKFSSSKAHSTDATTGFVVKTDSLCVWRFTSQFHGPSGDKSPHQVAVGLVIDYFIADGRSDVGWAVSYDCSKLAKNEIGWDARGPYFQFDWDGDGKFFGTTISGIRWGDKYKFKTVNYAKDKSSWDYSEPNTIPYMMLYKEGNNGDAEAGVVATVPWAQKDAGGYWWSVKNWGKTGTGMMENWNCPYQLNAYEGYGGEKMAWGTPFGFVGGEKYQTMDLNTSRKGYPFQGYAVSIVLNKHSDGLTDTIISSMEAAQNTKLTATTGTVTTNGEIYAGLAEKADYATPGWNPVYGVWSVACADNQVQCNLDVTKGALLNPVLCVSGYTAAAAPTTVSLNNAALVIGKDCYVSVDAANKRLWLTLCRKVEGSANALTIKP